MKNKYEIYKERLLKEFILPGTGQGCSIPANQRSDTHIYFGDGTLYLGWYMTVLATEENVDYDLIWDAVLSLERLMQPCGYFIRDDVIEFEGLGLETHSDFLSSNIRLKEESQDQVIHLLMGLMFVYYQVSSFTFLADKVKDLIERMIGWVAKNHWIIRVPGTGRIVARGAYAHFFSYPMSLIYPKTKKRVWWIFKFVWKHLMHYYILRVYGSTNLHLVSTVAAISNGWGEKTFDYLVKFAKKNDWWIYPMINAVLYPSFRKRTWRLEWEACRLLDLAPEEGPSYDSPSPWRIAHLFLTEKERQWGTGPPWAKGMRFSGLDFMLLHNLFRILYNENIATNTT